MSSHFSMGAINKETLKYEYPKIASKENKYKCPSCDKDVIFRKGKIKQSHYAHKKSDNPCYYYDRPSESQIHKDAKMLMKMLLDNKTNMAFYRKCYNYCEDPDYIFEITPDTYNDSTTAIIEYKFQYNNSNRSADVALVENDNIKYIFDQISQKICEQNEFVKRNNMYTTMNSKHGKTGKNKEKDNNFLIMTKEFVLNELYKKIKLIRPDIIKLANMNLNNNTNTNTNNFTNTNTNTNIYNNNDDNINDINNNLGIKSDENNFFAFTDSYINKSLNISKIDKGKKIINI